MISRDPLSTPLAKDALCDIDTMRLLVEAEKDRRVEYEEDPFDCTVVDVQANEMSAFVDRLKEISQTVGEEPARLQLIIKDGAHFLTVDFMLSQSGNRFLLLDAAGDPRAHAHFQNFSKMEDLNFIPCIAIPTKLDGKRNGIQSDFHSCAAFALDHACQVSWMPDIYEKLDKHQENGLISWSRMPPELVWNAQSYEWLDNYSKLNKAELKEELPFHERTFSEMLSKHFVREAPRDNKGRIAHGESKRINNFAQDSYSAYQDRAKYYLEHRMPLQLLEGKQQEEVSTMRPK
jgi:hypothetical protein